MEFDSDTRENTTEPWEYQSNESEALRKISDKSLFNKRSAELAGGSKPPVTVEKKSDSKTPPEKTNKYKKNNGNYVQ